VCVFAVSSKVRKCHIVKNRFIVNRAQNGCDSIFWISKENWIHTKYARFNLWRERKVLPMHPHRLWDTQNLLCNWYRRQFPREYCKGGEGLVSHFMIKCSSFHLLVQLHCILLFQHWRGDHLFFSLYFRNLYSCHWTSKISFISPQKVALSLKTTHSIQKTLAE
jgi:hypothetical protein